MSPVSHCGKYCDPTESNIGVSDRRYHAVSNAVDAKDERLVFLRRIVVVC